MTPTEWDKLQGFINNAFLDENGFDRFNFLKNIVDGSKYKRFGNTVSIPVAVVKANFTKKCFINWRKSEMPNHNDRLISSQIASLGTKTHSVFVEHISSDFRSISIPTSHEYVKTCWNRYKSNCPQSEQNQSLNCKIFETIVATCLYREGILPFFLQAQVAFVPNVDFDIVLFKKVQCSPIGISIKTSLRERYKWADLEAVALKYVHRNAENYLISLQSNEVENVKQKLKQGDLLGLNQIIAADTPEFDAMMSYLKSIKFTNPGEVPIISGTLVEP